MLACDPTLSACVVVRDALGIEIGLRVGWNACCCPPSRQSPFEGPEDALDPAGSARDRNDRSAVADNEQPAGQEEHDQDEDKYLPSLSPVGSWRHR